MLDKASIVWSAKQIRGMVTNGKINFDHIVQRSFVWERTRKSKLIESMIIGFPVPVIYAKRVCGDPNKRGDNIYYIMDGKQRLSAVAQFLNDEFELTELPEITYYDIENDCDAVVNISGKKFSELPEPVRDNLMTITFNITYFDNLTPTEEIELFKRLNNGKPLSAKARLLANCKDINDVLDIGNHKIFNDMLSEKAFANKNQATIVMKCWAMINKNVNELSFEGKVFNSMVENITITESEKLELLEIFNFIDKVHSDLLDIDEKKVVKKLYTETHFVSLIPYFKRALREGISVENMSAWLIEFFGVEKGTSNSEDYNNAAGSGVAKSLNIMIRNNELKTSYEEYFMED